MGEPLLVPGLHRVGYPGVARKLGRMGAPEAPALQLRNRPHALLKHIIAHVILAPPKADEDIGEVRRDEQGIGAPKEVVGGYGVHHRVQHEFGGGRPLAVDLIGAGVR